jgi:plasmid maintenance system killer protein
MNASQLLEVTMKVFVNQDQEAKWEAGKKIKRKVGLLAAALSEQSGRPQHAGHGRERDNPHGQWSVPLNALTLKKI